MFIWINGNDLRFMANDYDGRPVFSYACFAPQSAEEFEDLKKFADKHGGLTYVHGYKAPAGPAQETSSGDGDEGTSG